MNQPAIPPNASMPTSRQVARMERRAVELATAILQQGHALDAPDSALMTRLLVMRTAAKVIAALAKKARTPPAAEIENAGKWFAHAVRLALQDEGAVLPAAGIV